MMQIIDNITNHKTKSSDKLYNQQISYIPRLEVDQIEYIVSNYWINGVRTLLNQSTQLCFKLNYLRFKPMTPRKTIEYKNNSWSMEYLISEKVIYPFMIFINGLFIPWDLINISIGQENYYLVIDTSSNTNFKFIINQTYYVQTIALPDNIEYTTNYNGNDVMFSFNENGEFDMNTSINYAIKNTDYSHIVFNQWNTNVNVNAFPLLTDTSVKLSSDNIILFKNNKLATGDISNIKRSYDSLYTYDNGFESQCVELIQSDMQVDPNPTMSIDSTLLTIDNGINSDNSTLDFIVFINDIYTETVDNISKIELEELIPIIENDNLGISTPDYLEDLKTPFEMEMSRNKSYDENIADCIKTMMSYNTNLFNSVFKDTSNLIIDEYTGEWINNNTNEDGTIVLSRQHNSMNEEDIIMLVNGSLYNYYRFISYRANQYIVPIQGIEDTDIVEFLRFQNINNSTMDITINEDSTFTDLSDDIINDNMVLFSNETNDDYFTFPDDGIQHFPVEYSISIDDNGDKKIILSDDFYYGKTLTLAYKNRFKQYYYYIEEDSDSYIMDLGDKFMYCNDYSKYFVFLNGRRLGSDHYRLTLPVRTTTPFYKFDIYLTILLSEGDRLEIVYVPSLMQDIVIMDEIETTGEIVVDKSILNYGISTDLYMVWINGKKIPASYIADIDSTKMRIIVNTNTIKTVCITKYIPDIDVLSEVFSDNESLWDKIISQLSNDEIYTMLGINGESLMNIEDSVYENAVNIRSIMYELIREQFLMNPRVDTTDSFVYDYQDVDTSIIDLYDNSGSAILPVMDGNLEDNLDNVERVYE